MESIHLLHLTTISPLSKSHIPLFLSFPTPFKPSLSLFSKPPFPTSKTLLKPYPYLPIFTSFLSNSPLLTSFASEIENPSGKISGKIDIESILLSIDGFFNKYSYFDVKNPFKSSLSLLTKPPLPTSKTLLKPYPYLPFFMSFLSNSSLFSSFASEMETPSGEISGKIDIESILLSIDGFFNKYPYFVFSVTFVWLIVIPLVEEYFKKFKFITALNGFKKLRDDSSAQLLDIRDDKSFAFIGPPNLKFLNKNAVHVVFDDGDFDGFLIKVKELFQDPENTVVCVVDNFDGNSIKVAELLVNNGFKEAYAIKGGLRGKKGWQEIQEELLPPSVHIFPKKKAKKSQKVNSSSNQSDSDQVQSATSEK